MALNETPHSAPAAVQSASSGAAAGGAAAGGGAPLSDFHKQFPQVPASENVVQEFQCSLSRKKLLRVGRLYVTPVRLCFSSMLVDSVELPWEEIASCEKKSQMLFDQIIITPVDRSRYGGELCFTGFMNGASSPFSTVKMLWNVRKKYSSKASKNTPAAANAAAANAAAATAAAAAAPPPAVAASPTVDGPPTKGDGQPQTPRAQTPAASPAPRSVTPGASAETLPPTESPTPAAQRASPQPAASASSAAVPEPDISAATRASPSRTPGATSPAPPLQRTATEPPHAPAGAARSSEAPATAVVNDSFGPERRDDAAAMSRSLDHHDEDAEIAARSKPADASLPQSPSLQSHTPEASPVGGAASPPISSTPPRDPVPAGPLAGTVDAVGDDTEATDAPDAPSSPAAGSQGADGKPPTAPQHRRTKSDGLSAPDPAQLQSASVAQTDLLKTFPNVPKTESILDSFQCSYVSGVHRLGKMHITGNYLLFQSVMLAEAIVVRLTEVKKLEKSTSLLVLDGLSIILLNGTRYEFTSFISREKAFSMLTQLIATHDTMRKSLGGTVSAGARPASPSVASPVNASDRSLGDEVAASPPVVSQTAASSPQQQAPSTPPSGSDAAPRESPSSAVAPASPTAPPAAAASSPTKEEPSKGPVFGASTASATEDPIAVDELNDFDKVCPTDYGTGFSKPSLFLETPLTDEYDLPSGYNMFDVFRWVFDDEAPVLNQYRDSRRDQDVAFEKWRAPAAAGKQRMAGQRCMRCQTIIRALITEKYYPFEEFQRFAFVTLNGKRTLLYQTSGQASGVTFSDTFRTESLCVYTESTDAATGLPKVSVRHYVYVQFLKFSIVKSKIRTESTKELKEGMHRLNDLTTQYLRTAPSSHALERALSSRGKSGGKGGSEASSPTTAAARSAADAAAAAAQSATAVASPATTLSSSMAGRATSGTLQRQASTVMSAGSVAAGPGVTWLMPPTGPVRAAMSAMMVVAAWYLFRCIWNAMWFYAEEVPLSTEGRATVGGATSELQQVAAMMTLANFAQHVLRPGVAAAAWTAAAFVLGWLHTAITS